MTKANSKKGKRRKGKRAADTPLDPPRVCV
jgi:hypothetical protein